MKHQGAQSVYLGLLKIHDWIVENRDTAAAVPEWVDDEVMDMLDLFVGWCAPQSSLRDMIEVEK